MFSIPSFFLPSHLVCLAKSVDGFDWLWIWNLRRSCALYLRRCAFSVRGEPGSSLGFGALSSDDGSNEIVIYLLVT